MIAVHLRNNQRFAEAQKWFHLVFDPTSTDSRASARSASGSPSSSGTAAGIQNINTLLALLSTPDAQLDPAQIQAKTDVITGYNAILAKPVQARTSSPAPARAPTSGTS